jgi:predicted metal-dependent hydrolase
MSGRDTVAFEVGGVEVEVRRSAKRRRTVSAYKNEDGTVVVLVPARMSRAEEQRWVTTMVGRLERQERRRRPSDDKLMARARELSRTYLDGQAQPTTVRWVDNQQQRWGSCTPADGSIRLSSRLQGTPSWVIDCVLLHELAHLLVHDHSPEFYDLADRHPKAERAKGFLEGFGHAQRWQDPTEVDSAPDEVPEEAQPPEPDQLF